MRKKSLILKKSLSSSKKKTDSQSKKDINISVSGSIIQANDLTYPQSWINANSYWKKHTELHNRDFDKLNSSQKNNKQLHDLYVSQKKLRKKYDSRGLYPLFIPRLQGKALVASNELVSLKTLSEIPVSDFYVEKTILLSKEEKKRNIISSGGQNLQARVNRKTLKYEGLFYQRGNKQKPINFAKAKEIRVDSDNAGHFIAYANNLYAFDDPVRKNVRFDSKGELQSANKLKSMKFLAGNIVDSANYERNKDVRDFLQKKLGRSMAYRNSSGKTANLNLSEQQLAICDFINSEDYVIQVKTPDRTIDLPYTPRDIKDSNNVIFKFEDKTKSRKMLNSDDLLRIVVSKLNIETDTAQSMIESLYHSGWINYPRATVERAEEVPIKLTKDISSFQGTTTEKSILDIIKSSWEAYENNTSYMQEGKWILSVDGETITSIEGFNLADTPHLYTKEQIDIDIEMKGITDELLTNFLITNEIGTPATRSILLKQLRESGVVSKQQNNTYVLDGRGIVLAGSYEVMKNNEWVTFDLKKQISKAKTIEELNKILTELKPLSKTTKNNIIIKGEMLLEIQEDLQRLDEI